MKGTSKAFLLLSVLSFILLLIFWSFPWTTLFALSVGLFIGSVFPDKTKLVMMVALIVLLAAIMFDPWLPVKGTCRGFFFCLLINIKEILAFVLGYLVGKKDK